MAISDDFVPVKINTLQAFVLTGKRLFPATVSTEITKSS
jgi:hypothetical protein